jgi:hypothetical protein
LGFYFDTALLFDPEYGIEAILTGTDWTFGTGEGSGDEGLYCLHGQVSGEQISPLTFAMVTSGRVAVDTWVRRDTFDVQRIELVELDSDPGNPTRWLIELADFNEPVEIEAPPIP